jgi:hypothetical protein
MATLNLVMQTDIARILSSRTVKGSKLPQLSNSPRPASLHLDIKILYVALSYKESEYLVAGAWRALDN